MLKQAFGWDEDLQEEVVPLSNVFSNRLDDFVDTSDEEDVISRRWTRNATSPWLPRRGKNRIAGNSQMQEGALGRNRVAGHSKREERATGRNGVAGRSDKEEEMESANGDMSEVSFLNRGIIKCNWKRNKKDETLNPQVDEEKHPLARKSPRHTSSGNWDIA